MKLITEVSGVTSGASSDTEPDFGNFLGAGKVRKLGAEMSGKADAWFANGGYTQTNFPSADDMWGGEFENLTVFNLDPGIYRKSSQELMKVPKSWESFADASEKDLPDSPNTVDVGIFDSPSEELSDGLDVDVPKYTDFF